MKDELIGALVRPVKTNEDKCFLRGFESDVGGIEFSGATSIDVGNLVSKLVGATRFGIEFSRSV